MAKKITYRHKNSEKSENDIGSKPNIPVLVNEETRKTFEEGQVILIDKPLHWTSFDVVRKIRGALRIKKVGHAGTLDPLATGLLIVCTGKFTKKINEFMAQEKEYTGTFTLGATTPTYDLESEPIPVKDQKNVTEEQVYAATAQFIGEVLQKPPMYSAIKKNGTALYELARRGEELEIEARKIFIKNFSILKVQLPVVYFNVICSTGTYIRSLANDFGAALGCGAYLSELRRTRIGAYAVDDAANVSQFLETLG